MSTTTIVFPYKHRLFPLSMRQVKIAEKIAKSLERKSK